MMPSTKYKLIIFDFDGTLAQTISLGIEIAQQIAPKYGFSAPTYAEIEILRDKSAQAVLRELNIPFWKLPFILRDMRTKLKQRVSEVDLHEDIPQLIHSLSKEYTLTILTSNSKEAVNSVLNRYNLTHLFASIETGSSLFGKQKHIRKLIQTSRLACNEILYVGDEIRDIHSAKAAGIHSVAVTWGLNTSKGLILAQPEHIVDTISQLKTLLIPTFDGGQGFAK